MSHITLKTAQDMIADYQDNIRPVVLAEGYSTDLLPLNITLPKSEIASCLGQSGAESLRIYFAVDRDEQSNPLITTILVAVNEDDEDIIPTDDYIIINKGARCPTNCPPSSVLTP